MERIINKSDDSPRAAAKHSLDAAPRRESGESEAAQQHEDGTGRSVRQRTSYNAALETRGERGRPQEQDAGMPNRHLVSESSSFAMETTQTRASSSSSASTTRASNLSSSSNSNHSNSLNSNAGMEALARPRAPPSLVNPPLLTGQPSLVGQQDLSSLLLLQQQQQQQNLQSHQRLAEIAAAQTIAEAQRLGGAIADPVLLTALANNPPLPSSILGIQPTLPGTHQATATALSQAALSLQQQQQQQQLSMMRSLLPSSLNLQGQQQVPPTVAASLLAPRPLPPTGLSYLASHQMLVQPFFQQPLAQAHPVWTADLYLPSDEYTLSDHQILLRQQIEFFQACPADIQHFTPGRRKEISVSQVGIRCKHCSAVLQPHERTRGTVYFPATLRAIYQAAQNMGTTHFLQHCNHVHVQVRDRLQEYAESRASVGSGGKQYWAEGATSLGIYETEQGLRLRSNQV